MAPVNLCRIQPYLRRCHAGAAGVRTTGAGCGLGGVAVCRRSCTRSRRMRPAPRSTSCAIPPWSGVLSPEHGRRRRTLAPPRPGVARHPDGGPGHGLGDAGPGDPVSEQRLIPGVWRQRLWRWDMRLRVCRPQELPGWHWESGCEHAGYVAAVGLPEGRGECSRPPGWRRYVALCRPPSFAGIGAWIVPARSNALLPAPRQRISEDLIEIH